MVVASKFRALASGMFSHTPSRNLILGGAHIPNFLYGRFRTEHMYRTYVLIPVADQTTIRPRVTQIGKSICVPVSDQTTSNVWGIRKYEDIMTSTRHHGIKVLQASRHQYQKHNNLCRDSSQVRFCIWSY